MTKHWFDIWGLLHEHCATWNDPFDPVVLMQHCSSWNAPFKTKCLPTQITILLFILLNITSDVLVLEFVSVLIFTQSTKICINYSFTVNSDLRVLYSFYIFESV